MEHLPTPIKPKVSLWLRLRRYSKARGLLKTNDQGKDEEKQVERSEDEGKLAALLDITLDVFFEIVSYLRPIDLLQLCRVSRKFRATFMSKSARHLWIAARKNGDVLPVPDPLPGMSEPRFAAMLFDRTCFACGAYEAEGVYFALGFRFCGECARTNLKTGQALARRKNKGLPDCIWNMIPIDVDWLPPNAADDAEYEKTYRMMSRYYVPEFEMVVAQYRRLDGQQAIDKCVERRMEYVASVSKSAQAIMKWYIARKNILKFGSRGCRCHRSASIAVIAL